MAGEQAALSGETGAGVAAGVGSTRAASGGGQAGPLTVNLVTPEGTAFSGAATYVAAPTVQGPIGIYAKHEPILAILERGEIAIEDSAGKRITAQVSGGFLSVDCDTVTVVADSATVK